jgi:hypothetical protein
MIKNIEKIADDILMFEFFSKQSAKLGLDYKDFNKAFTNYISNTTFPLGSNKVPYSDLPLNLKERVWSDFWKSIATDKSIEKLVEETMQKMKQPIPA